MVTGFRKSKSTQAVCRIVYITPISPPDPVDAQVTVLIGSIKEDPKNDVTNNTNSMKARMSLTKDGRDAHRRGEGGGSVYQ